MNGIVRASAPLQAPVSVLASTGSWLAACALALYWFGAYSRADMSGRQSAVRALLGVGISYIAVEGLGWLLPRPRPFSQSCDALQLVRHAPHRSFPSRHVASAFAMSLAVSDSSAKLALGFAAIGASLGAARVAAGVHYPSDVLGGAVLGTLIGRIVRGSRPWHLTSRTLQSYVQRAGVCCQSPWLTRP
jgi:undecaprenyl-diphosphatase